MTKAVLAPSVPMVPKCISEIIVPIASDMAREYDALRAAAPLRRLLVALQAEYYAQTTDPVARDRGLKPLQGSSGKSAASMFGRPSTPTRASGARCAIDCVVMPSRRSTT